MAGQTNVPVIAVERFRVDTFTVTVIRRSVYMYLHLRYVIPKIKFSNPKRTHINQNVFWYLWDSYA